MRMLSSIAPRYKENGKCQGQIDRSATDCGLLAKTEAKQNAKINRSQIEADKSKEEKVQDCRTPAIYKTINDYLIVTLTSDCQGNRMLK